MLTHFSLFSGIGGIDLAAEWAGFQTVGQCEWADYPTKILQKHWPDVERWRDVRTVTRHSIRDRGIDPDGITLLSGGFPCQPHSLAGKRKASLDERDLWGEFARVICETHPRWVLGENVAGLLSSEDGRFFGRVLRDLAEMGYRVGWACYGACDVGANHQRERVFIVGYSKRRGLQGNNGRRTVAQLENRCQNVSNSNGYRGNARRAESERQQRPAGVANGSNDVADTEGERRRLRHSEWKDAEDVGQSSGCTEQRRRFPQSRLGLLAHGIPAWLGDNWRIEPDIPRVATGVKNRVDQLKCYGNSVVPQQVYPILQAIADIEKEVT